MAVPQKPNAGMPDYLKEAFLFRWNLLFFLGGLAAAALTPVSDVLLPLVAAGELTYLTGLISIPRFRAAIDAKVHAAGRAGSADRTPAPQPASLVTMLGSLSLDARTRFERLHARCVEMRGIAAGVRGAAGNQSGGAEEIRTPGLDRLLWLFLRLLLSKTALDRFLQDRCTDRTELLYREQLTSRARKNGALLTQSRHIPRQPAG